MKKIIISLVILLIIPIIGVNTVNNKNYELETVTNTYTKEEIDSKLEELRTSINNNKTNIESNKNILTAIQKKLNDYALKTSLNKTNNNIDSLNTIVTNNTNKITNLENLFKEGTATASDILSGKTAIVGGSKITGTMQTSAKPMTLSFSSSRSAYSGNNVVITNNTTVDTSQYSKVTIDSAYIWGQSASSNYYFARVDGIDAVANVGKTIDVSSKSSITVSIGRTDGLAANVTCQITLS